MSKVPGQAELAGVERLEIFQGVPTLHAKWHILTTSGFSPLACTAGA